MTSSQLRTIVVAVVSMATAVVFPGCVEPEARTCPPPYSYYCPAGSRCAARQAACIFNDCGDGVLQQGESCDDGNIVSGDGCSADCKSNETCGNGVVDSKLGEVCDDGNIVPNDGCSADCKSLEKCGDGKVSEDEECDAGPSGTPGLAKETASCNSNCKANRCGDGIVNRTAGEQCDRDGDGQPGTTGQSIKCNYNCTNSTCGDGVPNLLAGEKCDDGPGNSLTGDCLPTCQPNVCGDGFVNKTGFPREECDEGQANSDTGACLVNCRKAACGDGHIQANVETCDEGPSSATVKTGCPYGQQRCSACSACQTAELTGSFCGDGKVDTRNGEECDNPISNACGTCQNCRKVAPKEATGSLTVLSTAVEHATFTLGDGKKEPVIFDLVRANVCGVGHSCIDITNDATTAAIALRIESAIRAAKGFTVSTTGNGNEITLTNGVSAGINGNQPITTSPANAALVGNGMAGGVGCPTEALCLTDSDCVSNTCGSYRKCN